MLRHSVVSVSFVTPRTVALQTPLSLGLPRWEYWSGLLFPSPGNLPDAGIKPRSLASPVLTGRFFTTVSPGKPKTLNMNIECFSVWRSEEFQAICLPETQQLVWGSGEQGDEKNMFYLKICPHSMFLSLAFHVSYAQQWRLVLGIPKYQFMCSLPTFHGPRIGSQYQYGLSFQDVRMSCRDNFSLVMFNVVEHSWWKIST